MNISTSVEIALIKKRMSKKELAGKLGTSQNTVSKLCKGETCSGKMLNELCSVFDLKASEFIALGE